MSRKHLLQDRGSTFMNVLVAMAMIGILSSTAISNLKITDNPLADASFQTNHFLRLVRSQAISNTQAVQITPVTLYRMNTSTSDSCSGTMTANPDLSLDIPNGARLTNTTWSVCFTARGLADATATFTLQDTKTGATRTVEIALGGGSRIQ